MIRTDIRETIGQYLSTSLKDFYHRPFEPEINEAAKAWVVNSACTGPEDHGLAAELWTLNELAKYTRSHAPAAGQSCLSKAAKATIWRILSANEIRPHKSSITLSAGIMILSKRCMR